MLYKTVIFSDAPVLKGMKYRDRFQLVPFYYSEAVPISRYARHFPAFLEYEAEELEEELACESELNGREISEDVIKTSRYVPNQERVKREILQLLTCLTNYHFFSYDSSFSIWGIQIPSDNLDGIGSEELVQLDGAKSKWTIGCYCYPGMKKDLELTKFSEVLEYYDTDSAKDDYFTNNPGIWLSPELSFPKYLEFCLDRYYALTDDVYKRTKHCIGLLTDGIALFDTKRSVSLLAIVSSIEGLALLDYEMYGEKKGLGAKNRFTRYLKRYVAGKSNDKFEAYYKKRCDITHEGALFIGDLDVFSNSEEQHKDWMLRLEIMQAARIALYHWLRRKLCY